MSNSKPYIVYANLFYVVMITFQVFFLFLFCSFFLGVGAVGEYLLCLIVLVVKLLTGTVQ